MPNESSGAATSGDRTTNAAPEIRVERDGAVATVVVSNPARRNALSVAMLRRFPEVMRELDADDSVRVIVLAGAGERAFVSGADISDFAKERADRDAEAAYMKSADAALLAPVLCRKPVLASIRGVCIGGGLQIACACDIRIAAQDASFMMPAARLGVGYPYSGMAVFVRLIGAARTADLFFSARTVDAAEALQLGLIDRLVPARDLDDEVRAYAAAVAANAPLALEVAKASIRELSLGSAQVVPAAILTMTERCWASADFIEGRDAFLQKRRPRFQGR